MEINKPRNSKFAIIQIYGFRSSRYGHSVEALYNYNQPMGMAPTDSQTLLIHICHKKNYNISVWGHYVLSFGPPVKPTVSFARDYGQRVLVRLFVYSPLLAAGYGKSHGLPFIWEIPVHRLRIACSAHYITLLAD